MLVLGVGLAALLGASLVRRDTRDTPRLRLSNPVRLTSVEGVESFPAWSPDGRLLAYASQSDAMVVADTDIWIIPVAGGKALNRTAEYTGVNNFPSWLPDGSGLTFRSDRDGPGIYTMPALAGATRKLVEVQDVRVRTGRRLGPL